MLGRCPIGRYRLTTRYNSNQFNSIQNQHKSILKGKLNPTRSSPFWGRYFSLFPHFRATALRNTLPGRSFPPFRAVEFFHRLKSSARTRTLTAPEKFSRTFKISQPNPPGLTL